MLANPILCSAQVDYPATEFWIEGDNQNTTFFPNGSVFDAISAKNVYNKKIIPTEAFTRDHSDFGVTPATMKPIGDKVYAYGINQFEMHTYIHQTDDKLPGWQHYMFGISWGKKITWWDAAAGELTSYFARTQSLLQKGNTVADVLLYTGEEIPNSVEFAYNVHTPYELMPKSYKFDIVNSQVLQNMVSMDNGLFSLPHGLQYKVLVLPPSEKMSLSVLQKIQSFTEAGGIVVGQQPTHGFGLADADDDQKIIELAEKLWKSNNVYTNISLNEVLKAEDIRPDFAYEADTDANIMSLHKKINDQDVYFLSNQSHGPVKIEASFRQNSKKPEIWMPESGEIIPQTIYNQSDNSTLMPLRFENLESKFVVFSPGEGEHITGIEKDGTQVFPNKQGVKVLPIAILSADSLVFSQSGNYTLKNSNGNSREVNISSIPDNLSIDAPFTVGFDEKWGGPDSVTFDKLISWTEHSDPGIKHYSGTGV